MSLKEFDVTVHTSPGPTCGTFNRLWLTLIGLEGETRPTSLNPDQNLLPGSTSLIQVQADGPLGQIILVRLRLEAQNGFPDVDWHCNRIEVCGRGGVQESSQMFLCDRWLRTADGNVELPSGKLCLQVEENEEKRKQHRLCQLKNQQELIRWRMFFDGTPHCVELNKVSELGPNLTYIYKSPPINVHYLKGFTGRLESWTSFEELDTLFALSGDHNSIANFDNVINILDLVVRTVPPEFVKAHWKEDWYFGHQCLNGCNPLMLHQIHLLPPNLAVTPDMLRPFLPEGSSLEAELQKGTIYLLDYEVLDGLPANVVNGKQTYLSAPLCLLHLNQQDQLVPIAIQLLQVPGPHNPVFLPSDPPCDWLLAKTWVHSADFQCHQLVSHYLRTHMMAELSCVATLRQLPEVHPLYQLLMPHVRTSIQINIQARASLLAAGGVFDQAVGSGMKTIPILLNRASTRISYRSMCVPDDLMNRGVDKLPQSFYAQDALRIWDALYGFVAGWVDLYYRTDADVLTDSELQHWITDLYTHSFTNNSGFPQSFSTKVEVSKFVTMVIYSCSAQHAAVNFSQVDFALWMPNCPSYMSRPPPEHKGETTEKDFLSFLPDVNASCRVIMALTMLSQPSVDFVPLCHYKEAIFTMEPHCRLVEEVQRKLQIISEEITERNRNLDLPYPYLHPKSIENSVAI